MIKRYKHGPTSGMPSLTIDNKRALIKDTLKNRGEKTFQIWLNERNIPSVKALHEKVRQHKAAFFRDLFDWGIMPFLQD